MPDALKAEVLAGGTGRQRYIFNGEPYLAVGVNLAEFDAQYFEVFPLAQLACSLRVVGGSLILGSAVAATCSPPPSDGRPVVGCCGRCPASPRPRATSPPAASTPGWNPSRTRTSTGW